MLLPFRLFFLFCCISKRLQNRNGSSEIEKRDLQTIICVWNLFTGFRQYRKPNPRCFPLLTVLLLFSFEQLREQDDKLVGKAGLIHDKNGPGSQTNFQRKRLESGLQELLFYPLCMPSCWQQTRGVLGAVEPQEKRGFPGQGANYDTSQEIPGEHTNFFISLS